MEVFKTEIEGVVILEPKIFGDARGYFYESYSVKDFGEKVREGVVFVQDNQSLSSYGVLRGLHFQKPPHAQSKLVRVVQGRVLDVAVDIRKGSPTYGKHVAVELSGENHRQLFIPKGFAHGFVALTDYAEVFYKTNEYWHKESEGSIRWDDPTLNIQWPLDVNPCLSEKDAAAPFFKDAILFD